MKSQIYRIAAREALLGRARRRIAPGITVFMYHDVGGDLTHDDAWQIVRQADFRAQMTYLRRHYDLISIDEACARVRQGTVSRRPAAVITFDDGLIGNHRHLLPIVREMKLPVVIYVATEQVQCQALYWFDRVANVLQGSHPLNLDLTRWGLGPRQVRAPAGKRRWAEIHAVLMSIKGLDPHQCDAAADAVAQQVQAQTGRDAGRTVLAPMTIAMLQELAAEPLVTLGGHSHGHELLPLLDEAEARRSIETGKALLEEWVGRPVRHFAYPAGGNDTTTRELVRRAGFETAMGTQTGFWGPGSDPFEIPRISVGRYDELSRFRIHAVGGLSSLLGSRRATGVVSLVGAGLAQLPEAGRISGSA